MHSSIRIMGAGLIALFHLQNRRVHILSTAPTSSRHAANCFRRIS
jgi:hypothetical protein